ncbi:4'-phosphopantetheinyl transferase superfamily protein [Hirsutella rhossiliensis]|uniref:4'-phosphopantetheinyl transferase superfamily domain-containing protein n=1 Tax=Hirsutella rhossiliensis TaxID=111463 RepID=A0A9P8MZV1_9HYPO|nr:4'-phosphopantetheinyl transferase superfamily domain-containing protein [Hirsutella rhossiliensis]KAH0965528.1 4'-phosphopantetheinyl transferase superfamily domain-containing protein [Hirsutella rhossiliensis]
MRPLRAFPLALSVGTDICHIARIHAILRGPRRGRFVRRILAPEELAAADDRLPGLTAEGGLVAGDGDGDGDGGAVRKTGLWKMAVFVAGRFAAKEAAIKAHAQQHRRLGWHDIVIERRRCSSNGSSSSGPPVARIKAGEGEGEDEDESALVSISHDGDYATAVCIAYSGGRDSTQP